MFACLIILISLLVITISHSSIENAPFKRWDEDLNDYTYLVFPITQINNGTNIIAPKDNNFSFDSFTSLAVLTEKQGFTSDIIFQPSLPFILNSSSSYVITVSNEAWISNTQTLKLYITKPIKFSLIYAIKDPINEYQSYFVKNSSQMLLSWQSNLINKTTINIPYKFRFPIIYSQIYFPSSINVQLIDLFQNSGFIIYGDDVPCLQTNLEKTNYSSLLIPYYPYFQNCKQYGDYLILEDIVNNQSCFFVNQDEIIYPKKLNFGSKPFSHHCSNIEISCQYTIKQFMDDQNSSTTEWYQLSLDQIFFYVYEDEYHEFFVDADMLDELKIIPAKVISVAEKNKFPKKVELFFYYYQINELQKKIVKVDVSLDGYIEVPEGENNIFYSVTTNYLPMSHTELLIEFALSWEVYMIVYVGIGIISIIIVGIFLIYKYIYAWYIIRKVYKEKTWPVFYFKKYLKLSCPPMIMGVLMTIPIITIYLIIFSIAFTGHIFNFSLWNPSNLYAIVNPSNMKLSNLIESNSNGRVCFCLLLTGAFIVGKISKGYQTNDSIKYDGNVYQKNYNRISVMVASFMIALLEACKIFLSFSSFFSSNIWLMIVANKIFNSVIIYLIDLKINNNLCVAPLITLLNCVENLLTWGAPNFLQCLLSFIIELNLMMFDKTYFSQVVHFLIQYLLKVVNMILTRIKMYEVFTILIFTFNFFDFCQIKNRSYLESNNKEKSSNANEENEISDESESEESFQSGFSSGSEILLTLEDKKLQGFSVSSKEFKQKQNEIIDLKNKRVYPLILPEKDGYHHLPYSLTNNEILRENELTRGQSNIFNTSIEFATKKLPRMSSKKLTKTNSVDPSSLFQRRTKKNLSALKIAKSQDQKYAKNSPSLQRLLNKDFLMKQQQEFTQPKYDPEEDIKKIIKLLEIKDDHFELLCKYNLKIFQKSDKKPVHQEKQTNKKKILILKIEQNIGHYADATSESLASLIYPWIILWMWLFFDELGIPLEYGVTKRGILYYFLFALTIIPFYIIIDVFFLNILHYYLGCEFVPSLEKWRVRFKNRKNNWKGHDYDINFTLPQKLQQIDQHCFSVQYYFMLTFHVCGLFLFILGLVGILKSNYNPIIDNMSLVYVIVNICILELYSRFILMMKKLLGLWNKKKKKDKKKESKVLHAKKVGVLNKKFELSTGVIKQIENIRDGILTFDSFKTKLESNIFLNASYKENYITDNEEWIKNNLAKIMTPRTLMNKRDTVFNQFNEVYGSIDIDASKEKKPHKIFKSSISLQNKITKLPRPAKKILKYWLYKSQLIIQARKQIGRYTEIMTENKCSICMATSGLRSEIFMPLYDILFEKFLNGKICQWNEKVWQNFVMIKNQTRTICYGCALKVYN